MKKITLYPYLPQHFPIVATWNQLNNNYQLLHLVANVGSGLSAHDAAYAIEQGEIGITVHNNILSAIEESDALMVLSGRFGESTHVGVENAILYALSLRKEVICAAETSQSRESTLSGVKFLHNYNEKAEDPAIPMTQFHNIQIPVIFVGSLYGGTDEDYVTLKITEKLTQAKVKVSGFATDVCCQMLGLHTYPYNLFDHTVSEDKRILYFNQYINNVVHTEHPDILIFQLPTGMMRFNDYIINSFGIIPYIIAQSVACSYMICCSANDVFNQKFWENISQDFYYRYGHNIDAVHLSNATISYMESIERKQLIYFRTKRDNLHIREQQAIRDKDIPVYNFFENDKLNLVCFDIIDKLLM